MTGHVIELLRSHRFSGTSGIGRLSRAIIQNDKDILKDVTGQQWNEAVQIDKAYDADFFQEFISGYEEYIREPDISKALEKFNKLRVLVAVRDGEQGLYAINKRIEDYLRRKGLIRRDSDFYENKPIIVTKNNPDLGLFNGDVGIIRRDENDILRAWFPDSEKGIRPVLPAYISDSETVFAMTIHKSQGSEYENVLVILPDKEEHRLLTRELLYTAVTRAKKTVCIQAREATVFNTCEAEVKRSSGIAFRF